jgi:hypothetical protein
MPSVIENIVSPPQLVTQIQHVLGDADCNTALTALEIVRLLVLHKNNERLEIERQQITSESVARS